MTALPIAAMLLGFLAQNLFEWRGGGPVPPADLVAKGIFPAPTRPVRGRALVIISFAVCLAVGIAAGLDMPWLVTAIAAALSLNAVLQVVASLVLRKWMPGTLSGMLLMLPGSVWVLTTVPPGSLAGPALLGIGLSGPVLLATWWIAACLSR